MNYSISPLTHSYNNLCFSKAPSEISKKAVSHNDKGKTLSRKGSFDEAVSEFKKALAAEPEYPEAQMELAKTYKMKKDYKSAITEFEKYLKLQPDDSEAGVMLGDCYKQQGFYGKAIEILSDITSKDPNSDFAQRSLKDAQNLFYSIFHLEDGIKRLDAVKQDTINKAVAIAKDFLPQGFTDSMGDLNIKFNETQKLSGYSNIAQYEHSKRAITISQDYIWANPKLVAAYVIHEFIHAKDNDAYTSIQEEQDAFRKQAQYWQENGKGISDPEMDYILGLYNESPTKLDDRVYEIYTLRDPEIAMTSPNHPPDSQKVTAATGANQNRIKYDTIA